MGNEHKAGVGTAGTDLWLNSNKCLWEIVVSLTQQ